MTPLDLAPTAQPHATLESVVIDLLLAFVLGTAVAWLYARTHQGLSYSRNMVQSLVLLSMIVSMVMLVVGDSVARAFGLVGALAIIRFRTVVRDARDTTFIFFALAIGIAIGAHQYSVAVGGALVIGATIVLLQAAQFGSRHANAGALQVCGNTEALSGVPTVLARTCRSYELLSASNDEKGDNGECTYRIRLLRAADQEKLIAAVHNVRGVSHVKVAVDETAEEW